jgi:hypothetical protein
MNISALSPLAMFSTATAAALLPFVGAAAPIATEPDVAVRIDTYLRTRAPTLRTPGLDRSAA